MRALGPQSMSSFLKTVLDVVHGGALAAAALSAPAGIGLLAWTPLASSRGLVLFGAVVTVNPAPLAFSLMALALYLAFLILILDRLRKVTRTLTVGDPFQPENVGRLRFIGLGLIGLEAAGMPLRAALNWLLPQQASPVFSLNLTAWFAVLVVFVLAEVFREGARLRRDAELTI
jgi:hypothetical protein